MTDRRAVVVVDERNLPAEQLEALGKALPCLATGLAVVPQSVSDLIDAAKKREVEIIQARHAAEMGAMVLTSSHSRRDRVLSSILSMAIMAGCMPIGLGIPSSRLDLDDYGPPLPAHETTRALHQPVRSPAEVERRKKRKAQRKSRKGRR